MLNKEMEETSIWRQKVIEQARVLTLANLAQKMDRRLPVPALSRPPCTIGFAANVQDRDN